MYALPVMISPSATTSRSPTFGRCRCSYFTDEKGDSQKEKRLAEGYLARPGSPCRLALNHSMALPTIEVPWEPGPEGRLPGLLEQAALPVTACPLTLLSPAPRRSASSRPAALLSRQLPLSAEPEGCRTPGPAGWKRKKRRETPDHLAPLLEPPADTGPLVCGDLPDV